jgi:hypothetical protein
LLVAPQGRNHPPDLKVVGFTPASVVLPTQDGASPAGAPKVAWPVAFITIIGLVVLAEALLRSLRKE